MDKPKIIINDISKSKSLYDTKCIECGKIYQTNYKTPCGVCPECEQKHEYFCNNCGQQIDYWEYNNNYCGFCDDCIERLENEEEEEEKDE